MTSSTHTAEKTKGTAVFTCILAALAGLMFGLDIGVISGATQFIQQEFQVSDRVIEWIVSSMMLALPWVHSVPAGCPLPWVASVR